MDWIECYNPNRVRDGLTTKKKINGVPCKTCLSSSDKLVLLGAGWLASKAHTSIQKHGLFGTNDLYVGGKF